MDDTKFLIIRNKNDYEEMDWLVLDEVREFLNERGYQIQCQTDWDGICMYCDTVREILQLENDDR